MTHRFRVLALLLTATVAQVTVFDEVRVAGASVEYLLLVSVLTGYHGGPERGAVVAFFAGLLHDAVTVTPMGLHALVYPSLAVATSHLEVRLAALHGRSSGAAWLSPSPVAFWLLPRWGACLDSGNWMTLGCYVPRWWLSS